MSKSKIDIVTLIKGNKHSLANRDGQTPLFAFAEDVVQNVTEISSEELEKIILELNLTDFDFEEINTLNSFVYYSQIKSEKIIEFYYDYLNSNPNEIRDSEIIKRGLLIRFIIERNIEKFSAEKLLNESLIRKIAPWIWIDCISYYNWELTVSEISKTLSGNNDELKNLLFRLPAFKKRIEEKLIVQEDVVLKGKLIKEYINEAFKTWGDHDRL